MQEFRAVGVTQRGTRLLAQRRSPAALSKADTEHLGILLQLYILFQYSVLYN